MRSEEPSPSSAPERAGGTRGPVVSPHGAAAAGRSLPSGTVTFLFTDIEGSTRLAEALADAWPAMLERHRQIVREAITTHGGVEVMTEGDGFFAVFGSASEGLAAAVQAQRDLAAEAWPPEAPIRVRMGLHAGAGSIDSDGLYVGHDVHRAARVGAAGHGGQIVITESVRALGVETLPEGVSLRDLGQHRLKDLRPQPLMDVAIDGLPSDFPPIRSIDSRPNNLPAQLTSFIGRQHELEAAVNLLESTRLLTLTGPGGTGKTRMALQLAADIADRFPDGVWFVPLEPLRDPVLVLPTVAHAIAALPGPGRSPIDALAAAIGERRMLMVLDNFEQVIEAAGDIAGLLRACPALKVVVTSRAVLRVAGEQEFVVSGLPAPPDPERLSRMERENLPASLRRPDAATLDQYEAVRLFIARAKSARPDFSVTDQNAPAVAGITARLRGMPLALELAAARIKLLSPEQVLTRLEQQLGILTSTARDLPDRQRTLRGAIEWSYQLLDQTHQGLLARLSTFRGGWELEAAEAVATTATALDLDVLDGITNLLDQSLIRRVEEEPDAVRFSMLDSIRELAAEMLAASGDTDAVRDAHAAVFLALAEEAAPELQGTDQRRWLDRLERDHDNVRAAISFVIERSDADAAVRFIHALWRFWQQRGYLDEARRLVDRIIQQDWELPPEERARFAEAAGGLAYWQADLSTAVRWYDEALEIRRGEAVGGDPKARRELANALYNRAYTMVAQIMGAADPEARPDPAARPMLEEALAIYRDLGDTAGEGNLLWGLGGYLLFAAEPATAEAHFRQAIDLHRAAGRRTMEAWSLHMLGVALVLQERIPDAREVARHALRHFSAAGDVSGVTLGLDVQAVVALAAGERARGGRLWGAARELQRVSGTGLADWDLRMFAMMPFGVRSVFSAEELEAIAAEGAAISLSEAVAYALGESDPFVTVAHTLEDEGA